MISCALTTLNGTIKALADLSAMVREYGSPPATMRPHPVIRTEVLDEDGNLCAADIGITWAGNQTFLHGVRVVGPGPPRPAGIGPAMSTPYQPTRDHDQENTSTTAQPPTPPTPRIRRFSYAVHRRRYVRGIDRPPPFSASTTSP